MLSLYVHIPFCYHKCAYCSFFVVPENDDTLKEGGMAAMKQKYFESLKNENQDWASKLEGQQIRTIYIGGGTPFQLGSDNLLELIDTLLETWDTEYLEELSIELNPDPMDEVIAFVSQAQKKYKDLFRLRFSFGIQTLDDNILQSSKRNYIYNHLIHWFRELVDIKTSNAVYNLDFIAFGANSHTSGDEIVNYKDRLPRDKVRRSFFEKLVTSKIFDGFSIYTLELFPGAERYYKKKIDNTKQKTENSGAIFSDDETIWKEFQYIKNVVMDAGYHRYEISNFALRGKRSLHNMVYWSGGEYLGLGINASGMIAHHPHPSPLPIASLGEGAMYRYKNTTKRKAYLEGDRFDTDSVLPLSETEQKSEQVMLLLRTDQGIILDEYRDVLVTDIDEIVSDLVESKHIIYNKESGIVKLRSKGLDIYNALLIEILEEF